MIKTTTKLALATAAAFFLASSAYAGPMTLSAQQMDSVAAGGVEKVDGFVCPVISTDAVMNASGGRTVVQLSDGVSYSIIGPDVSVPIGATNDNGAGRPDGSFVSPGDSTYTAIWNKG